MIWRKKNRASHTVAGTWMEDNGYIYKYKNHYYRILLSERNWKVPEEFSVGNFQ